MACKSFCISYLHPAELEPATHTKEPTVWRVKAWSLVEVRPAAQSWFSGLANADAFAVFPGFKCVNLKAAVRQCVD
jgi:hypothetical protein